MGGQSINQGVAKGEVNVVQMCIRMELKGAGNRGILVIKRRDSIRFEFE